MDGFGEGGRVALGDEDSGVAIEQDFTGAGGAFGGDDGYGAGLGFDEGVGESFVETGLDEDGGL